MSAANPADSSGEQPPPSPRPVAARWFHIIWTTYGTWLPGDPRGFRSRDHRIHSSGNVRRPPPPGEHAGLRGYARRTMRGEPVILTPAERGKVLESLLEKIGSIELLTDTLAVSATHVHLLSRCLPGDLDSIISRLRRHASHAMRDSLPGQVWSRGKHIVELRDNGHAGNIHNYILDHARKENASVWTRDRNRDAGGCPEHAGE